MRSPASLLHQCLDDAFRASSKLVAASVDEGVAGLIEAESQSTIVAKRRDLADAARELIKRRTHWVESFPQALRLAVEAPATAVAAAAKPVRMDSLTLVEDDQVDQEIAAARLSELLGTACATSLAELDGLISSVQGFPTVRPEANPLRPVVFAKVLRALMAQLEPQAAWPKLWIHHMTPALGRELAELYRSLSQALTAADVHAAGYRVLPLRPGAAHGGRPAPGLQKSLEAHDNPTQRAESAHSRAPSAGARTHGGSAWADLPSHSEGAELIHEFLFGSGSNTDEPLAPSYYARASNKLARLEASADDEPPAAARQASRGDLQLAPVDRPLQPVSTDTTLSSDTWGQYGASRRRSLVLARLKQQARHVGQVLGLEVVRKLVNQVAQDARLLAQVRESIVALEPSLLRLAMSDPRFFTDPGHPGRRLVERVAERSFKFNDESSSDFQAFLTSVAATFNGLNSLGDGELEDAEPFESALQKLEASWRTEDEAEAAQRSAFLNAMQFAERRQAEADRIAWELGQRSDLLDVPAVVQDFVVGPWALVMAHARLTDERKRIDPGAHGTVVTDLLWSVKRDETLRDPARMIEMLPGLLERLRAGLTGLGQAPQEFEPFFQALEKLHRPALRLRARKRRKESDFSPLEPTPDVEPEAPADKVLTERAVSSEPAEGPWMGRHELDQAGFEDTLPTSYGELTETASAHVHPLRPGEPRDAPAPVSREIATIIAELRDGCWVDLYARGRWLRAQLAWASAKGTLFMFVSSGGQPHSMTRRSCERLLRAGLLRAVDMASAVTHAMEALERKQPESLAA